MANRPKNWIKKGVGPRESNALSDSSQVGNLNRPLLTTSYQVILLMNNGLRHHHLRVEPGVLGQEPSEGPEVVVRPVHHGRHTATTTEKITPGTNPTTDNAFFHEGARKKACLNQGGRCCRGSGGAAGTLFLSPEFPEPRQEHTPLVRERRPWTNTLVERAGALRPFAWSAGGSSARRPCTAVLMPSTRNDQPLSAEGEVRHFRPSAPL